jgi:hypothetical protein
LFFVSEIKMENSSKKIAFRMTAGILVAITIIVAVLVSGITLPGLESKTGRLNVLLTDAPVDLEKLDVTITGVEIHKSGENGEPGAWLELVTDDITFNLLEFQNGKYLELASMDIPSGNYTKARLFVSEARATYKETTESVPLTVPPEKIDVITEFELANGGTRTVIIDMEPDWIAISQNDSLRPVLKATISEQKLPVADFTYTPENPTTEDEITFDASLSTDIDGTITAFSWDLDDGSGTQTGIEITHTYLVADEYNVTLTVTDSTGLSDTISKIITVQSP